MSYDVDGMEEGEEEEEEEEERRLLRRRDTTFGLFDYDDEEGRFLIRA